MAGGGAAGLGLAYHLTRSSLRDRRILIIDLEPKRKNDRTWCSWRVEASPFAPIVAHSWSHVWFHGPDRSHRLALNPFRYELIRGEDYYQFVDTHLAAFPNVHFHFGRVARIVDGDGENPAVVEMEDGTSFAADWVFDSLFLAREFRVDEARYHFLKQHFVGWFIRTEEPVFDVDAATLFDLRVDPYGEFRFMYLLPTSPTESLVEYTLFSSRLLPREEYEREIERYIPQYVTAGRYEIVEREDGIIPMTDQPFPRRGGRRILHTGTKGGAVKASTGFAFERTQRDCLRIVDSLERAGDPFHGDAAPRRYAMYDSMLLSILERHGGDRGREIFAALFENNPMARLFGFLDEQTSFHDDLKVMASVPPFPFIAAFFRVIWRRLTAPMRRQPERATR